MSSRNPNPNRKPPASFTMPRTKAAPSLYNVNELSKLIGAFAVIIVPIWGYFTLQRDTKDNKTALDAALVRLDKNEADINAIDRNGTQYGRLKIDNRVDEIAEVKARVVKVESAFAEIAPKIARIDDHVEQMWGDYNSRSIPAAPRIDARRLPKN